MENFLTVASAALMILFVLCISGIVALERSDNQLIQEQKDKGEYS